MEAREKDELARFMRSNAGKALLAEIEDMRVSHSSIEGIGEGLSLEETAMKVREMRAYVRCCDGVLLLLNTGE